MRNVEVIQRAIAAHAAWKHRLQKAIDTVSSDWTSQSVRSDADCEFGQWLASLPPAERASKHCAKVVKLHQEFHEVVSSVLALAVSGRTEEARKQ